MACVTAVQPVSDSFTVCQSVCLLVQVSATTVCPCLVGPLIDIQTKIQLQYGILFYNVTYAVQRRGADDDE